MQTVEERAREALNEVLRERGNGACWDRGYRRKDWASLETACRLIEAHDAFKQEVSDAVEKALTMQMDGVPKHYVYRVNLERTISRFIIPKPVDQLVEAVKDVFASPGALSDEQVAYHLNKRIAARGGKIVWDAPDAN